MRLAALLCAAALARAQDAPSVTQRWAGWLADEVVAQRYSRTREEVEQFGTRCAGHAAAWAAVADAHASLARVLVVDTRHNWNGLGDRRARLQRGYVPCLTPAPATSAGTSCCASGGRWGAPRSCGATGARTIRAPFG